MATMAIEIFKGVNKLGAGTATSSSASITSFTATITGTRLKDRNVMVHVVSDATHKGRTYNTRILADNGSGTLTLSAPHPYL